MKIKRHRRFRFSHTLSFSFRGWGWGIGLRNDEFEKSWIGKMVWQTKGPIAYVKWRERSKGPQGIQPITLEESAEDAMRYLHDYLEDDEYSSFIVAYNILATAITRESMRKVSERRE